MDLSTRLSHEASLSIEGVNIICRTSDGYVNATQLCKAGDKEYKNWKKSQKTEEFMAELESAVPYGTAELCKYENNGSSDRATWVHPRVAINIAQWISPKFDVKVSAWVHELLVCGSVKYGLERSDVSIMHEQLKQMTNTLQEKNNELILKDDKICYLTQLCESFGVKLDENHKLLTETKKIVSSQTSHITDISNKLSNTEEIVIAQTHLIENQTALIEDIAERCVPVITNKSISEVYCLLKIEEFHYYVIRAQKKGITAAIKKYVKSRDLTYTPVVVREWLCSPNSVLLHHAVKTKLQTQLYINRNDIWLVEGKLNEAEMFEAINNVYNDRY
jgi:hypothetical protein